MSLETLAGETRFLLEARKSQFLARAAPVDSAAAALAWLASNRESNATHNCWAYRVASAYRFSDDGEPGGTAGRPILAAIDAQAMDCVVVVVARWYGGINLGAGGLARAYGGSAAECLKVGPRRRLVVMADAQLECEFSLSNSVHALLKEAGAEKLSESFSDRGLRLRLRLPASMVSSVVERLRNLSRGTASLAIIESAGE